MKTKNLSEKAKGCLKSISPRTYVNCFERAWRNQGILTEMDIAQCDRKVNGLETKVNAFRNAFESGEQCNILRHCIGVQFQEAPGKNGEPPQTREELQEKARKLYGDFCNSD